MTELNRRSLITGLISLVAAPAIVRAGSLMPVKAPEFTPHFLVDYGGGFRSVNYAELMRITRDAFLPRIEAQLYAKWPVMSWSELDVA